MKTLYLLLSHDADLSRLERFLLVQHALSPRSDGRGGTLFLGNRGEDQKVIAHLRLRSAGVYLQLGFPDQEALAAKVAGLVPVRALRLFFAEEAAWAVAVHSWWGPDIVPDGSIAERTDRRAGLHARACYAEFEADTGEILRGDMAWVPPSRRLAILHADITSLRGTPLNSEQVAAILAQVHRAWLQGEPAYDPLAALLGSGVVKDE